MSEILHLVLGYFGLGFLVTGLCVAGAVFITAVLPPPLGTGLRRVLIEAAVVAAVSTTIYGKGYLDCHAEWDKAIAAQIKIDTDARARAERDAARGMSDHRNRDQQSSSVRPVARDHVLGKR